MRHDLFSSARCVRTPGYSAGGSPRVVIEATGTLTFAGRDTFLAAADAAGDRMPLLGDLARDLVPLAAGWRRASVTGEVLGFDFRIRIEDVEVLDATR